MIFCGYLKSTRGVIQVHLIRTKNVFRNIIPFSRGGEINYKSFFIIFAYYLPIFNFQKQFE